MKFQLLNEVRVMEKHLNDSKFIEALISVVPSKRQLELHKMGYYNFIHFGLNTFTKKEWGSGSVSPEMFRLRDINVEKWVTDLKSTGSKGIVITAKHHDGFCLFPSKYTDYTIASTVYKDGKGDIVGELAAACKKHSMKLGVYLSPWDRHEKTYGTKEYSCFFVGQLTELCSNYGELFCVWFDGACGEGKNGRVPKYDWERYYKTIRALQPNACIINCGPDFRWIGNEFGKARESEYSVVPASSYNQDIIAAASQQKEGAAVMTVKRSKKKPDIGLRETLVGKNLCWYPSEMDIPVTYFGWFYRREFELFFTRTVGNLCRCWYNSVGHNATIIVNVPPNKNGELPKKFIKRMCAARGRIENRLSSEIKHTRLDGDFEIKVSFPQQMVRTVSLSEDVLQGQRVEEFEIIANKKVIYRGKTIGLKQICLFKRVNCSELTVKITQCRSLPQIAEIHLYN